MSEPSSPPSPALLPDARKDVREFLEPIQPHSPSPLKPLSYHDLLSLGNSTDCGWTDDSGGTYHRGHEPGTVVLAKRGTRGEVIAQTIKLDSLLPPGHGGNSQPQQRPSADEIAKGEVVGETEIEASEPAIDDDDLDDNDPALVATEKQIIDSIHLDVLGELERGGVKVFSEFHRKSHVIPQVSRLSYEELLQIAGPRAKRKVKRSQEGAGATNGQAVAMSEVRDAISLLAGYKRIGEQTELGVGCWQGVNEAGEEYPSVVLVGAGEAAEWNGKKELERITHPRCRGHLLDFDSAAKQWYDHEKLDCYLKEYTPEFGYQACKEATELFARWRWKQADAAKVTAGLVFATWVQSLWTWRPQVAISGASNSGKSYLHMALEGLFGSLCLKSSQSSAAGIRQIVRTSSMIVLCDEFENSRYRKEILEMLRISGRGDQILRGTAAQKGQRSTLRHIVWLAAIEMGLKREPDKNRFVMLDLLRPEKEKAGQLKLPPKRELSDLGMRTLATAIHCVDRAKEIAAYLMGECRVEGVSNRIIESYSAPIGMLCAIGGDSDETAERILRETLAGMNVKEQGDSRDEHVLMDAILGAQVHIVRGERDTVGTLLQKAEPCMHPKAVKNEAYECLERHGLKLATYGSLEADEGDEARKAIKSGDYCLVIAYRAVSENILKGTDWAEQAIDQILRRVDGAIEMRRRIGGRKTQTIVLNWEMVKREFLNEPDEAPDKKYDPFD